VNFWKYKRDDGKKMMGRILTRDTPEGALGVPKRTILLTIFSANIAAKPIYLT
jgi:hypothetical protein